MQPKLDFTPDAHQYIAARSYWRERLQGFTPTAWFKKYQQAAAPDAASMVTAATFDAPAATYVAMKEMAPNSFSRHLLLWTALAVLVQKYAAATDVVLFTPSYKSDEANQEDKLLPVRLSGFADQSLKEILIPFRHRFMEDMEHGNLPTHRILNMEEQQLKALPLIGIVLPEIQPVHVFEGLSPELIFSFDIQHELSLTIRYDLGRFSPLFIQTLAGHYFSLLSNLMRDKNVPVSEVGLITPGEEAACLREWEDYAGMTAPHFPASYHQERLWFIDQFESGYLYKAGPVYHNIPLLLDLSGDVQADKLEKSVKMLLLRHTVLRTVLIRRDEHLSQQLLPVEKYPFELQVVTVAAEDVESVTAATVVEPFRLDGPLLRGVLFVLPGNRYRLLLTLHHAIADHYTIRLLAKELLETYQYLCAGKLPTLTPVAQYGAFSLWQQQVLTRMERHLFSWWQLQLDGRARELRLPVDKPRAAIHTYTAGSVTLQVPSAICASLDDYSEAHGVDRGIVLMAAFKVLLFRYARQEKIIIGTPMSNRQLPGTAMVAGPLENLVAISSVIRPEQDFNAFVQTVRDTCQHHARYGIMPFDKLVKEMAPEKDMSRTALFDVLFRYVAAAALPAVAGLDVSWNDLNLGYGKYDLNLLLQAAGDAIQGTLVYNADYYESDTVHTMAAHYVCLLEHLLATPGVCLSDVDFLREAERQDILTEYDFTGAVYPEDKSLTDLFSEQVQRTPEQVAVKYLDDTLTYAELDQLSDQLAAALCYNGVQPGDIVALLMDRCLYTVAGMLGILKAGAAYLPIDTDYPDERIAFFLQDTGAAAILTTADQGERVGRYDRTVVFADQLTALPATFHYRKVRVQPSSLCYLIYTSGTTGTPKGVMIDHRNVVRLFFHDNHLFDFNERDTWTMFHSHCFDFSVWEIYGALLFGGRVIVIPKALARDPVAFLALLREEQVTILNQTPAAFYNLIREAVAEGDVPLYLRYVIFGGEALHPGKLKAWRERYPAVRLINMFGITETTVHVTYKEIGPHELEAGISNIGRPIPTLAVYILDDKVQPVPRGVAGELYVGGEGVARGYWGNQVLTDKRFVDHPFGGSGKLYRTGDLVRRLGNGDLEFIGRADSQVQLRGFRIEPGEIEHLLQLHEKVNEAAVMVKEREDHQFLVAYYVSDVKLPAAELRSYLLEKVAEHMVPSCFMQLEQLPLTQNGKLDRAAFPMPELENDGDYTAPRNEQEAEMAAIWSEILNIAKHNISINTSFFELGGHSLLAPILISTITQKTGLRPHLKTLYQYPTIALFTTHIYQSATAAGVTPATQS